jgi:hypothetical protein
VRFKNTHGSLFALDGPAYFAKSTSFALKMFFEIKHYFTFTIKLSSMNTITYSVQVTKSNNLHNTCIQEVDLRTPLHVKTPLYFATITVEYDFIHQ